MTYLDVWRSGTFLLYSCKAAFWTQETWPSLSVLWLTSTHVVESLGIRFSIFVPGYMVHQNFLLANVFNFSSVAVVSCLLQNIPCWSRHWQPRGSIQQCLPFKMPETTTRQNRFFLGSGAHWYCFPRTSQRIHNSSCTANKCIQSFSLQLSGFSSG